MQSIQEPNAKPVIPFSSLGFRPFFFAAGLSGMLLMLAWMLIYQSTDFSFQYMSNQIWHAHEMIFGYTMAVVVGFLLTAVKNWTNRPTITGWPLFLLFLLWLIARITPFIEAVSVSTQAILDSSFLFIACFFISKPIIQAKAWGQIGIASKVLLMALAHVLFYLGVLGWVEQGIHWGLYGAFYMILALIFVMLRRVVPFFIEKGIGATTPIKNYVLIDRLSLVLFLIYAIMEVLWPSQYIILVATALLLLHGIRLILWHHNDIWSKPLLWSLYLAYIFLTAGFALKVFGAFIAISPFIILHSFALGIGLLTISMMSRVSLGHSGRNVMQPPASVKWIFMILLIAYGVRVLAPMLDPSHYTLWITGAQIVWSLAFLLFLKLFAPIFFTVSKGNSE